MHIDMQLYVSSKSTDPKQNPIVCISTPCPQKADCFFLL